ncbi:unnamed protein product [Phytophthora fragariaefolia]|uniref:Unnamed protein product n=1 Tax=Phytophthora fragariaefolia TaxID=1490495 RepID=A0A9W6Y482_9STRA|nr:unnamed protein product [Phytophthora fragariaefolia]
MQKALPYRSPLIPSINANVVEYSEASPNRIRTVEVANPPSDAATITRLPSLSWKHFPRDLKAGEIEQVWLLTNSDQPAVLVNVVSDASSSRPKAAEPKSLREARFAAQSWAALHDSKNPVYSLADEFEDIFPEKIPAELPAERGVRHEIDLGHGAKYCVTQQWPLPRDQVQAIDEFFEGRRKAGHIDESFSPHSSPTFCVKKATGGWCVVHIFNKFNDATIPAQTPIPRKDMVLDTMSSSVIYSAIDLTDGFYQILMRESDIPLTAVSTPSGTLWEWLVMPQGLKNAPTTINRMMKPAEKNYPGHDKELLAMRYALIKFSVYLLGEQTLAGYTDHASLRTATESPHLSQRMARWLSFFADYNFVVHYKPAKNNILDDAPSRSPDYEPRRLTRDPDIPDDDDDEDCCATCVTLGINATVSSPVLPLRQQICSGLT